MKAKTSEAFTEILVELAKVNAKLDKLLELSVRVTVLEAYVDTQLANKYHPQVDPSYWQENAARYALSSCSLTDAGVAQEWTNPLGNNKVGD